MPGPGLGPMEYAMAARKSGAVYRLPIAARRAKSRLGRIGPINRGRKRTGERSARKSHATFDVAGGGNVMMAAGLRGTAKVVEHPPEPKIGAPVLDPTATDRSGSSPDIPKNVGFPRYSARLGDNLN